MTTYFIISAIFFLIGIFAHIANRSFNKFDTKYVIGSAIIVGLLWPFVLIFLIYTIIKLKIVEYKTSKYIDDYNKNID